MSSLNVNPDAKQLVDNHQPQAGTPLWQLGDVSYLGVIQRDATFEQSFRTN